MVLIKTTLGDIKVKLAADKAPLTVANFLAYADAGHYNGTIFHRVIDGFMIQGGGFDAKMSQKPTRAPIKNEAANGLQNKRGTLAMARTAVVEAGRKMVDDLTPLLPKEEIDAFVPALIMASTLDGKLVMLPRAQFDVSALYYQKSLYQDEAKKKAFKEKYGYELTPPDTWQQVSDQAAFFSSPPDFYGTQFAGKEAPLQDDYIDCWDSLEKKFDGTPGRK